MRARQPPSPPYSLLYSVYLALKLWLLGIRDAFRLDVVFRAMRTDENVRQVLFGVVSNALSFFFVLTFFRDFPSALVSFLFSYAPETEEKDEYMYYTTLICQVVAIFFLYIMWYAWSIWNGIWMSQLVIDTYRIFKGEPRSANDSPIHKYIAKDVIFRFLSNTIFTVHIVGLSLFPPFGKILSCFFFGLHVTFQAWEIPWALEGKSLLDQMEVFETKWPYFVGFGTPVMLFYYNFSGVLLYAVLASMNPLYTLMAAGVVPPKWSSERLTYIPSRIEFFGIPRSVANSLLLWIFGRVKNPNRKRN